MLIIACICEYFNLNFHGFKSSQPGEDRPIPVLLQVVLYIGAIIGVLFSGAIMKASSGTSLTELSFNINLMSIAVASIIAIMIIPDIYDKLMINRNAPFIVQFGLFVQNGVFWNTAILAIGKVVT